MKPELPPPIQRPRPKPHRPRRKQRKQQVINQKRKRALRNRTRDLRPAGRRCVETCRAAAVEQGENDCWVGLGAGVGAVENYGDDQGVEEEREDEDLAFYGSRLGVEVEEVDMFAGEGSNESGE